jgi:hypothetical protein
MKNALHPLHLLWEENATFLPASSLDAKKGVTGITLLDVEFINALVNPFNFEFRAPVLDMPCITAITAGNVASFALASPASPTASLDKGHSFTIALPDLLLKPEQNHKVTQDPHHLHNGLWVVVCALDHIIGKIILQLLIS